MLPSNDRLKITLAQVSPVWLDKKATIKKAAGLINKAGKERSNLIVFGEAFLPGYPFWIEHTNGAKFNSSTQKELYAYYVKQAVTKDDLTILRTAALKNKIALYIGTIERAEDRGGHSLYCSLVFIDSNGIIKSIHRKLMPTYEERLVWAIGDGNGLAVHKIKNFTTGGLNCWENWMPLVRSSLYSQGEDLHIAVWPGNVRNTEDITRFIANEARSFVVSVSSVLRKEDIPRNVPHYDLLMNNLPEVLANGGSCVAAPNGDWLIKPVLNNEELITTELNFQHVLEERQNFDPSGHYSRPDVTKLIVNKERQSLADFI